MAERDEKQKSTGERSDQQSARSTERPESQEGSLKVHGDKLERAIPKK